ncbi:MAG: AAA family ATPase [Cyclobacteriaceae bacterium]|nr:AAA family ATPase [Cyclobacteriaceae bacterium]
MKITAIQLQNLRGFQNVPKTDFSERINIFIGANNSGKSTLLNAIFQLQRHVLTSQDITIGQKSGKIELYFSGTHQSLNGKIPEYNRIICHLGNPGMAYGLRDGADHSGFNRIPEQEPNNLIYPYLSKRKTVSYANTINEANANSVAGNFENLYSKIDRLITPQFQPGNSQYVEACENILGFQVSTLALGAGKKAVYFVHNLEHIPLTAMGEGVANIVGLITDLCVADGNIFLIEEPENDIHPKALKALLRLIIEKSEMNQFFVSTHSNIVMKYLGGATDSKIFKISNEKRDRNRQNMFVSEIKEVSQNPEDRRRVLEDLGYDFFDFDLWKGWLFLEESSAEVIIRDYLIEWFVKPLKGKIRTFSAGGSSSVIPKFEDFDKLFIFLHLEPTYKNRVWVIVDSGEEEGEIINKMREKYTKSGWNASNFTQFAEHDFEKYYPSDFKSKVDEVISITDKQERRKAKKQLLDEVKLWIASDEDAAKEKFKESAKVVIEKLKQINKEINK